MTLLLNRGLAAPGAGRAVRRAARPGGVQRAGRGAPGRHAGVEGAAQPRVGGVPGGPDPPSDRDPRAGGVPESGRPPPDRACWTGRGCCARPGLVQEAEASLVRAGEAQRAAGSWQDLAETEMARAECALLAGRPRDALRLARSARQRLARRSNLTLRQACARCWCCTACGPPRTTRRRASESGDADRGSSTRPSALAARCRAERRADLARRAELIAWEASLRAGARTRSRRAEPGGPDARAAQATIRCRRAC